MIKKVPFNPLTTSFFSSPPFLRSRILALSFFFPLLIYYSFFPSKSKGHFLFSFPLTPVFPPFPPSFFFPLPQSLKHSHPPSYGNYGIGEVFFGETGTISNFPSLCKVSVASFFLFFFFFTINLLLGSSDGVFPFFGRQFRLCGIVNGKAFPFLENVKRFSFVVFSGSLELFSCPPSYS